MIRTQVYLPEDIYKDLKLLSATSGMNFSELIREGVSAVVKRRKIKRTKNWGKDFFGAYKGKVKTNAVQDIHEYYKNDAI